ncbi:MAG TPA: polymer-forming cytoskeletal protein [Lachnospiraceae bacterium]|nr:polymer-forming cytoskeletal protein [Lachnospiraceae bacterium]
MRMIIVAFAFIGMTIFPLIGSYWFFRRLKSDVLYINQDRVRDPRYFASSFTSMMDKQWEEYQGGEYLQLSKNERILVADAVKEYPNPCDAVIIADKVDFISPCQADMQKEIYAKQDAYLKEHIQVRAIACKGELRIERDVNIVRWADAIGSMYIGNDCDLGICVSSGKELIIGNGCRFRRLYAPKIYLGQQDKVAVESVEDRVASLNDYNLLNKINYNVRYVDDSMVNENGIVDNSIVSRYDLTVLENIVVNGNLRTRKRLRICDNVIISGNVFAEEDIWIGSNSVILGNVFSQENIYIEQGAVIGKENSRISVVARGSITFERNCVVYGYVSNEQGGKTL